MEYNLHSDDVPDHHRFPYIRSGYRLHGSYTDAFLVYSKYITSFSMLGL